MKNGLEAMEELFKALADRTRLRILGLLMKGEICVCHIHTSLGIGQRKASRHLAYLKRAGLVVDRKDGLWVYYRLTKPADELLGTIFTSVSGCLEKIPATAEDRKRLEHEIGYRIPAQEPAATVHLL